MAEKRGFPRTKRRYLVEFSLDGAAHNGFTFDVSASGVFVRSARLPEIGKTLSVSLHLPDGKRLTVRGRVVRTRRVPPALSRVIPSGFAIRLTDTPEEYFQLLTTL